MPQPFCVSPAGSVGASALQRCPPDTRTFAMTSGTKAAKPIAMTAKAYRHNKRAVKTALNLSIKPLFRVIHRAAFPYYVYLYLPRIFKLVFDTCGNIVSHKHHLIVRYRVRLNNYAHLAARLYCV